MFWVQGHSSRFYQAAFRSAELPPGSHISFIANAPDADENRLSGPERVSMSATLNTLAEVYASQELDDRAATLLERSREILVGAGPQVPPNLAAALDLLGRYATIQQEYEETEPFYRGALDVAEKTLGANHLFVAEILGHYADFLREINRTEQADSLDARAQAIRARPGIE